MSRLLVDDVTKTDRRALLNVNKMATISDIVAPTREYLRASGADELTVERIIQTHGVQAQIHSVE
jgi:hypothetical protein